MLDEKPLIVSDGLTRAVLLRAYTRDAHLQESFAEVVAWLEDGHAKAARGQMAMKELATSGDTSNNLKIRVSAIGNEICAGISNLNMTIKRESLLVKASFFPEAAREGMKDRIGHETNPLVLSDVISSLPPFKITKLDLADEYVRIKYDDPEIPWRDLRSEIQAEIKAHV